MITTLFAKPVLTALGGLDKQVTMPLGYYFGLSSTEPNVDGTGYTEPTDPNYSRFAYYSAGAASAVSAPVFPFEFVGSDYKAIANKYEVHFNAATEDWASQMTYVLLFNQAGQLLAYAPLTTPITVRTGYVPTIERHAAMITIDEVE